MSGGEAALQIAYSPGYTAGSFFLPICVVGLAFFLFTISDVVTIIGTLSSGFLTGLAVCGMHYMGQGGISNYQPTYDIKNVVGAAVIAVVAATTALGLFFYSKSAWTDTWWKRFLCALLLAVAVSGMHWVATVGTNYRLKGNAEALEGGLSRQATVIIVLCLVSVTVPFLNLMLIIIGLGLLCDFDDIRNDWSTISAAICKSCSAGCARLCHLGSGWKTYGHSGGITTVQKDNQLLH